MLLLAVDANTGIYLKDLYLSAEHIDVLVGIL